MKLLSAALLATLGLSACATAPAEIEVANSRTYEASKDEIWERVVGYFATHNISIRTVEKASGIIAADRIYSGRFDADLARLADCGKEPMMVPLRASVDLNVFVRGAADGKTTVNVNTKFSIVRQFSNYAPIQQSCNSTGRLEATILDGLTS